MPPENRTAEYPVVLRLIHALCGGYNVVADNDYASAFDGHLLDQWS